jgi:hypothetical protein
LKGAAAEFVRPRVMPIQPPEVSDSPSSKKTR